MEKNGEFKKSMFSLTVRLSNFYRFFNASNGRYQINVSNEKIFEGRNWVGKGGLTDNYWCHGTCDGRIYKKGN